MVELIKSGLGGIVPPFILELVILSIVLDLRKICSFLG